MQRSGNVSRLDVEDTIPGLIRHRHSADEENGPPLGFKTALFWLAIVTAFIAILSEVSVVDVRALCLNSI